MIFRLRCSVLFFLVLFLLLGWSRQSSFALSLLQQLPADTTIVGQNDSIPPSPYTPTGRPTFQPTDRYSDPFTNPPPQTPLLLGNPQDFKTNVEIDTGRNYTIQEKIGDLNYRPPTQMSFSQYKDQQEREQMKEYWQSKSRSLDGESAVSDRGLVPKIYISPILDRIFGGSYVELVPRGFVTLDFGGSWQKVNNPAIPIRQQRNGGFEFDQQINMSVVGKLGDKMAVTANFDNNNSFDFQNNMKVEYTGYKEDVLQKLEIGNVSLPLNNTLIQGAQNLFGVKAQLQFGKLTVTSIASTQRGKNQSIDIPSGSNGQGRPFEIVASDYDENRHFFLGQFFRDNYERWIANPPQVISGVNVTRVEVYVLNRNNDTQTLRNVVGLMDLGEGQKIFNSSIKSNGASYPNSNDANNLFQLVKGLDRNADNISEELEGLFPGNPLQDQTDYVKISGARKLAPTEYTIQPQLGYISLTRKLQDDESLAVAYEYTYNGRVYKVGELSEDYGSLKDNEVVFLKLLRPGKVNIRDPKTNRIIPTWNLMMKNIYSLNVTQLTQDGFQLRVIYRDDRTGIDNPQLQEGISARNRQLIEIFGLDRLNQSNDPQRDGNFDYVEGITVNSANGLIIFPYLEPFSEALRLAFKGDPQEAFLDQKYSFDTLYHTTKSDAELFATKNKFYLVGRYNAGSAREVLIPGFGVTPGSVRVYAGGIPLTEGLDYTVDYVFGKVTILNDAILNSGKDISIQYEQADPFAFQTRSLLGTRLDYQVNDNLSLGGTLLYYNERPLVTRNLIGTEPARNLMYGLDFNYRKDSRLLTKIIDAIPGISTKETSNVNLTGEFAQLLPGTSNIVDGDGTAYIDDFENSATPYSLMNPTGWKLASTPQTDDERFDPSGGANDDVRAGYKRAKIAWYQIDNQFYRNGGRFKPSNITDDNLKNQYVRPVDPQEIFPQKQPIQGEVFQQIMDIAYYPKERGPYNYNPDLMSDGTGRLNDDATTNWGGITTAITTEVDFDKANIEYIEFWMLNPFITGPDGKVLDGYENKNNTTGGKLIFQLGGVSEDVLRDTKQSFENGLPPDGNLDGGGASKDNWGYVTTQQFLTRSFDNDANTRANQDVGLDGVPDSKEDATFPSFINLLSPAQRASVASDPSADDFKFYFDPSFDQFKSSDPEGQILARYKDYNGMEGNTPVVSGNDLITKQGSVTPDNEDLNDDNTVDLVQSEAYYSYSIDLQPGDTVVGKNYIVDKINTTAHNSGDPATWYQFRIPIRQFEEKFGNIDGFKTIKYLRMLMTGFSQPVVLRMANFQMVGSKWRAYTGNLRDAALAELGDPNLDNLSISVVNIEQNSQGSSDKSPYVLPPGITRDRDNTSAIPRELNEQSIQACVDNLEDGDARAIYKNLSGLDLFNYGRIKMFVHANSSDQMIQTGDLEVFMRFGTDFDQNYYEVAMPLKITQPAQTNDANEIWPEEDQFDIDLNDLYTLKADRDRDRFPLNEQYPREGPRQEGRNLMRIFGRPDMSNIQVIMIGVRNPASPDKKTFSVCIWANELRVTDFNRTPGWAVNSTASVKLADFATVTGAVHHTTFGFGSVSSKISERTRDETTGYDVSANVNVDKLIPGNTGIKIPMFVSYEKTNINPNYDPANPDLKLGAALLALSSDQERADYKKLIEDQTVRRSINFMNVRKTKVNPDAVAHIYDIENFAFSYSYSEQSQHNFFLAEGLTKQYMGSVAYTFTPKATGIEPFKNVKAFSSPYLQLIKDFNLSLLPSSISIRGDLDRSFIKNIYRNDGFLSDPNYQKSFYFNRNYNVQWNLSRNLSLNYAATTNAVIDEPEGDIDSQEKKDSIISNLKKLGRMKLFDQTITANYTLPLDKIPFTDWISSDYRYEVHYNWKAGPVNKPDSEVKPGEQDLADSLDFKNTIQNNRDQTLNGNLDMVKLYNKIGLLKKINTPPPPQAPTNGQNPKLPSANADTIKQPPVILKGILRLLMSIRSLSGTYGLTQGTILPGFTPTPKFFGLSPGFNAPGWDFVLGGQSPGIKDRAHNNGWLVQAPSLTTPFSQMRNKSLSARADIEPTSDFKIQLEVKKNVMDNYQEIYRYDDSVQNFISLNPSRAGSYTISNIAIRTAFKKSNNSLESSVFHTFENDLDIMRQRFSGLTGLEYDTTAQDILIPAFISAYTGTDPNTTKLSPFVKMPLPNWRIDYTGLSKLEGFKDLFQSVTVSHAYNSTYSVMNYSNSLQYAGLDTVGIGSPVEDYNHTFFSVDKDGQVVPVYVIGQVLISEEFAPLISVDFRTTGRMSGKVAYSMKRDLALNISNAQITEGNSKDFDVEVGYTKNNMKLPFKQDGHTVVLKNDVTFRLDLTVSNDKIIQRKIHELATITNGNINVQLRPNISYVVNQKLNLQLYFERTINDPLISNSYRRATTRFGVQARFSLAQ